MSGFQHEDFCTNPPHLGQTCLAASDVRRVPGVGMVRDVQPPNKHDYRRVRCAPEGHFVAVGRDHCDCGIERAMLP
jgi:hypothetical protein